MRLLARRSWGLASKSSPPIAQKTRCEQREIAAGPATASGCHNVRQRPRAGARLVLCGAGRRPRVDLAMSRRAPRWGQRQAPVVPRAHPCCAPQAPARQRTPCRWPCLNRPIHERKPAVTAPLNGSRGASSVAAGFSSADPAAATQHGSPGWLDLLLCRVDPGELTQRSIPIHARRF